VNTTLAPAAGERVSTPPVRTAAPFAFARFPVAQVVQELYPDKLDERAALVAHHLEQAGETLDAARWHRRAARWAGVHDHAGVLRHWQRARALLATMPESQEVIGLRLGCCALILTLV